MIASALRVLVVEDDVRLHAVLRRVLSEFRTTLVTRGRDALEIVRGREVPHVAVVDLGLPDLDGVALVHELAVARPALPVLVLTVTREPSRVVAALRAGARGYLVKEDLATKLAEAIEEAHVGGVPLSREIARILLAEVSGSAEGRGTPASRALTPREREVLERLAQSFTYGQVAADLGISVNTVRAHVRALYDKLEVSTRTAAVLAALERGLI